MGLGKGSVGAGVLKNDGGANGKRKVAKTGMGRWREVESLMHYKGRQITKYQQSTPLYSYLFCKMLLLFYLYECFGCIYIGTQCVYVPGAHGGQQ